jgi:hypothetical protein
VVRTTPAAKARSRKNRELSLIVYVKYGIITPTALQTRMPNKPPIRRPSKPSPPGATQSNAMAGEGAAVVPAQKRQLALSKQHWSSRESLRAPLAGSDTHRPAHNLFTPRSRTGQSRTGNLQFTQECFRMLFVYILRGRNASDCGNGEHTVG